MMVTNVEKPAFRNFMGVNLKLRIGNCKLLHLILMKYLR